MDYEKCISCEVAGCDNKEGLYCNNQTNLSFYSESTQLIVNIKDIGHIFDPMKNNSNTEWIISGDTYRYDNVIEDLPYIVYVCTKCKDNSLIIPDYNRKCLLCQILMYDQWILLRGKHICRLCINDSYIINVFQNENYSDYEKGERLVKLENDMKNNMNNDNIISMAFQLVSLVMRRTQNYHMDYKEGKISDKLINHFDNIEKRVQ